MYILGNVGFTLGTYLIVQNFDQLRAGIRNIDSRLIILGALLPDIMDKSIGDVLFNTGRSIFHTLFFIILLYLFVRFVKSKTISPILIGTCFHIIFDRVFLDFKTFLWPFFGLSFSEAEVTLIGYMEIILNNSYVQVTEIIGLIFILIFINKKDLYNAEKIGNYFRKGKMGVG